MFRLLFFSASTRRQAALLPLLMVMLPCVAYAQNAFTFVSDPSVFDDGDTIDIAYSVNSFSAIDQISFSHVLDGWEVDSRCTPEVILDNSWFCPNSSCEVTIDIPESRDSIHVLLARSSSSPISGSGEVLTIKGIEILVDDLWIRKAEPVEKELFSLSATPNPCSDVLVIESHSGGKNQQLVIRNLQGQIVWSRNDQSDLLKISVAHLPAGLYWLQIMEASFDNNVIPIRIIR